MHRFVWNLVWGSSGGPSDDEDSEYRSPSGPKTVPGTYRIRLTVDGKTQEQPLKIIMDPRSPATTDVLTQQFQQGQRMFEETIEARRALAEIASVQKQFSDLQQNSTVQNPKLKSALAEAQSAADKILANKEQVAGEAPGLKDAYAALASALRVVEGGDRPAPSQAIAVCQESSRQIKTRIADWTRFKQTRLAELNQQLRDAKIAPIAIAEIEQQVETALSQYW
jgi:hypothetical protein